MGMALYMVGGSAQSHGWTLGTVSALLSLTLLLPPLTGYTHHSSALPAYDTSLLSLLTICGISAVSPLLMDGIVDGIFYWEESAFLSLRVLLKSSFLLYCLVSLVSFHSLTPFKQTILIALGQWQALLQSMIILWMIHKYDRMNCFTPIRMGVLGLINYLAGLLSQLFHQNSYIYTSIMSLYTLIMLCISLQWGVRAIKQCRVLFPSSFHYGDYVCAFLMLMNLLAASGYIVLSGFSATKVYNPSIVFMTSMFLRFFVIYATVSSTKRFLRNEARMYKKDSALKTELVKYLSHEIRNPLNILAMSLEHVKLEVDKGNLDKEFISESIASLESGCCSAIEVLNELTTYEEIESERFQLNREDRSPYAFLRQSLQSLHDITSAFGVRLRIDVADHDRFALPYLLINVDQEKVGAVIRKIISKCIYEYQNGEVINVSLKIAPHQRIPQKSLPAFSPKLLRGVSFTQLFSDTRIAPVDCRSDCVSDILQSHTIHPGHIRIGVPFAGDFSQLNEHLKDESIKLSREAHGDTDMLGLSIWISRKVLILHGGDMRLLRSDKGNFIYIDIPYRRDESILHDEDFDSKVEISTLGNDEATKAVKSMTRRGNLRESIAINGNLKVLVVDDSHLNRKVIMRVLNSLGHECTEADDGLAAVEVLRRSPLSTFDTILMEYVSSYLFCLIS